MRKQLEIILRDCGIDEAYIECGDYISADIIDSLTMAEIIIAIEDKYKIEIDPEEIVPENFLNLEAIVKLVSHYIP